MQDAIYLMRRRGLSVGYYRHSIWAYEKLTGGIKAQKVGKGKNNKKNIEIQ